MIGCNSQGSESANGDGTARGNVHDVCMNTTTRGQDSRVIGSTPNEQIHVNWPETSKSGVITFSQLYLRSLTSFTTSYFQRRTPSHCSTFMSTFSGTEVMTQLSSRPRAKCELIPINLNDKDEFEELRQQRIICGWNSDISIIQRWREAMDQKAKSMFWVTIPLSSSSWTEDSSNSSSSSSSSSNSPASSPVNFPIRAGHISLDSIASPPDLTLANPDKSTLTISTFFIYPSHRGGRLGRAAMRLLENYATKEPYGSPTCKIIAINTLDRRYTDDDEWRTKWEDMVSEDGKIGKEAPERGSSNEAWYERMGYVKFKSEPRYAQRMRGGEVVMLVASFLRKEV